jgi:hypothetical protein
MSDWKYREFYDQQIAFLVNRDVDRLIDHQYNEDAALLSFTNHIKGAPALKEYFRGYLANLGYIKLLSTDKYTEDENSFFFEATVETARGIAEVYDVFLMRDGKVATQYTGLIRFTPHAEAAQGNGPMSNGFTQESIRTMALDWYNKLDTHAPEPELLQLLVSEGLEQNWPDFKVRNLADFDAWYQRALGIFFDEKHTVKEFNVNISPDGKKADVKVFVNWKARVWTHREAYSKLLDLDIRQSWEVVPSPETGKPLIRMITVDDVTPLPGSATL